MPTCVKSCIRAYALAGAFDSDELKILTGAFDEAWKAVEDSGVRFASGAYKNATRELLALRLNAYLGAACFIAHDLAGGIRLVWKKNGEWLLGIDAGQCLRIGGIWRRLRSAGCDDKGRCNGSRRWR
jgi:hypothetical protein